MLAARPHTEKSWDLFISHASEDKEAVALPLARALQGSGLRVWLDRQELRIGDSLREKIDEGLANSRFGAVILSPQFLAKGWPKRELNGLMAIEEDGRKVILPIWHEIDRAMLVSYSPILADRLAASTTSGIPAVAADIARVVLEDGGSPSVASPTLARRLANLLDGEPDPATVKAFLRTHARVMPRALGAGPDGRVEEDVALGTLTADLCVGAFQPTTSRWSWSVVLLGPVTARPFSDGSRPEPALADRVAALEKARTWIGENLRTARERLPDIRPDFAGVVVLGRRDRLTAGGVEALREYNDLLFGIHVRTYDWVVQAAVEASPG